MLPRRISRPDEHSAFTDSERHLILAAETLRSGQGTKGANTDEKSEERLSLFWRVFGGTILSICALIIITAYQQLANGIHDLRADVGRIRESSGEYIKKDEFNNRSTQVWNRITELNALNTSVSVLSNKLSAAEQTLASAERDRKDMQGSMAVVAALKEKLAALEEQRKVSEQDHKDLLAVAATLTAMKERDAAMEKQLKDAEAERRDMTRELQQLLERLAKLEGQTETKPAPKSRPADKPVEPNGTKDPPDHDR